MSKKNIALTVVLTIIFEMFGLFLHTDIKLISDWLGEMAVPAYLAGRDWSSALSSCSYYGWGLTWIYTPLFFFSSNPVFIWFGYKIINIIVVSLIAIIIYILQVRWLKQNENITTIIIAVEMALLTWIDFGKETTLFFGIWVSVALLLKTFYGNNSKKRTKLVLSIITPAVICYIKNIHEVAICLSMAFLVWVCWDYFVAKKKSVYMSACVLSWLITYLISNMIKKQVLVLYTTGSNREIYNTSAFQGTTLWFLESWQSVKLFLMIVWSNFYTLVIRTYGLALFAILLGIVIMAKAIQKKKITQVASDNPKYGVLFYSIVATLIVILGVAVNWGYGLYYGIRIGGKAFNYIRYYLPFFLPALLVCFSCLCQENVPLKKIKWGTFLLVDFWSTCYLAYVYPVMLEWSNSGGHIEWKNMYGICFDKSLPILKNIVAWILLVIVFMAILFWIRSEKKYLFLMTFLSVVSILERRKDFDWDDTMSNRFALPSFEISACNVSEKAVRLLAESGVDIGKIILADSSGYYIYSLQFLVNDIPFQCIRTAEELQYITDDTIILSSDGHVGEYIGQEYEQIRLDEGEYLYAQDIAIIEKVKFWLGD